MFSNCVVNYKTFVDFKHVFITIKKFKLIRKTIGNYNNKNRFTSERIRYNYLYANAS